MQHVLGPTEGPLGVDHPVFSKKRAEKGMKRLVVCQRKAGAVEGEFLPAKGAFETCYKLAAKDPAQDSHGQEESRRRSDPPLPVRRQAAARHNTVNMGMTLQGLPPGVQNAQKADLGSEVFGVGGDLPQGLTIRLLSISAILSCAASARLRPVEYSNTSIVR